MTTRSAPFLHHPLAAMLFAACLGLPGLASAQAAATMPGSAETRSEATITDLLSLYRDALASDASFAAARAQFEADQTLLPQARARLLPSASATASQTFSDSSTRGSSDSTSMGVSVSQPLYRPADRQTVAQQELRLEVSKLTLEAARQALALRVAEAYFAVLAAQDNLTFLDAQKRAITEQLAAARRNFEVGAATITDTHEAQARFDLVVAQELAAQGELEVRRNALQQLVGRPVTQLRPLAREASLPAAEAGGLNDWVQRAERSSLDVRSRELTVEVASREIDKARAGHHPTVDLVASASRVNGPAAVGTGSSTTQSSSLGVQVSVPLFSGYATQNRILETVALQERARHDLDAAQRAAAQAARQAFTGVNTGLAQVRAFEAAEVSSRSALEANRLGYQVGVRINIDVLNAQQQLFQTQRDLARARYDTLLAGLRLQQAIGDLNEDDLTRINQLLR